MATRGPFQPEACKEEEEKKAWTGLAEVAAAWAWLALHSFSRTVNNWGCVVVTTGSADCNGRILRSKGNAFAGGRSPTQGWQCPGRG
jgi:hypothetical protein